MVVYGDLVMALAKAIFYLLYVHEGSKAVQCLKEPKKARHHHCNALAACCLNSMCPSAVAIIPCTPYNTPRALRFLREPPKTLKPMRTAGRSVLFFVGHPMASS